MINIIPISSLNDNYIWLVIHPTSSHCFIVDPGDAKPVLDALDAHTLHPVGILLTHHHWDHTAGVSTLVKNHTMPVFGSQQDAISSVTNPVKDGEKIAKENFTFEVISIPGHTHGHVAYYSEGALFCGDTLFTGGCGRVFEGTMTEMYTSLQRLAHLPDSTLIYCGHEYTAANLRFAILVEPNNAALQQRIQNTQQSRAQRLPTVPSTLALEKATNPFLRCSEISVKHAAENYCGKKLETPEAVFEVLRRWKNGF